MGATTDSVRVWRDLLVLHARVIEELASALEAAHGLSVSEFDVLINLDPTTAIRHGDLADRVILSRTALTRLVDRLAKRGWVERQPDPLDQRAIRISLTAAGRERRRNAPRTNARIVRHHFAPLDAEQLDHLDQLLRQVRRAPPTTDSPPAAILTEAGGIPHPSSTTHEGDLS